MVRKPGAVRQKQYIKTGPRRSGQIKGLHLRRHQAAALGVQVSETEKAVSLVTAQLTRKASETDHGDQEDRKRQTLSYPVPRPVF